MSNALQEFTVTIAARGDHENSAAEAIHHGLTAAHAAGHIESWTDPEPVEEGAADAACAAIAFALKDMEGMAFLRCWNDGDFDSIRREWPEAPEAVFIGADPLHTPAS
jgi:hypothetical protein